MSIKKALKTGTLFSIVFVCFLSLSGCPSGADGGGSEPCSCGNCNLCPGE